MTIQEALKVLAGFIWDKGASSHMGSGCIDPDMIGVTDAPVAQAYIALVEAFDATHYDRMWEDRGKSVRINLYCAEDYGAAIVTKEMRVHSEVVQVGE